MHFLEQLLCRSFVCHQTDIGWSPAYRGKPPGRWISRLEWFPSGGSQRFPGWVEISCLMGWITNSGMGPWSLKRGLYIPTAFVHLMTGHSSEWWLNSAIKRWAAPELRLPGHKTKKTPMQKIPKALLESFRVCLEPTFDLGKAETWSERWEALNRERIMAQSQTHRQFFFRHGGWLWNLFFWTGAGRKTTQQAASQQDGPPWPCTSWVFWQQGGNPWLLMWLLGSESNIATETLYGKPPVMFNRKFMDHVL